MLGVVEIGVVAVVGGIGVTVMMVKVFPTLDPFRSWLFTVALIVVPSDFLS